MIGPRILILDIETSPIMAWVWGLWDQNIAVNQIVRDRRILSVAWKWAHEKHVHCTAAKKSEDEEKVLIDVWQALSTADIVVTQNGINFDMKILNTRFMRWGMPPPPPVRNIDTKVMASKHFGFTSNKLEWLGPEVAGVRKSQHQKFPGFQLWEQCLLGNDKAWKELVAYNKQDVLATEALWRKLQPWVGGIPNFGAYTADYNVCPKCGSSQIECRGFSYTQLGKYQRYVCKECGGWSKGRVSLLGAEARRYQLAQ